MLALLIAAEGAAGSGEEPVPAVGADAKWAPVGRPPAAVELDGQRAWRFDGGEAALCCEAAQGVAPDSDALTVQVVVQLRRYPEGKRALLSQWDLADGRAFELGLRDSGQPFFSISESGRWPEGSREITGSCALRLGVPVLVSATWSAGRSMSLHVGGDEVAAARDSMPGSIHRGATPVWLGGRPGAELPFDGILGAPRIWTECLSTETLRRGAASRGLLRPLAELSTRVLLSELDQPVADPAPIRAITRGPRHHWFGYYDKLEFDPSGRHVLGMAVDFEHRTPTAEDVIEVGMVDLEDGDRWIALGESRAWCWQQGCMLQWRPGSDREVVWNDRDGDRFVTRVHDVVAGTTRTLPRASYHLSPDGRWALSLDFARVQRLRPGYGYVGLPDPHADDRAPRESGIWRMDLDSGRSRLLLSIADMRSRPVREADDAHDVHYFNHLQWAPDSRRFFFLHRWRSDRFGGFRTRGLTAAAFPVEGAAATDAWSRQQTRLLSEAPGLSHFEWWGPERLMIWRQGAYRSYRDDGRGEEEVVWRAPNGHQSRLPGGEWWITDTYPRGPDREQVLHLYHVPTDTVQVLGRFAAPPAYRGEWRCDLHPRLDPHGRRAVIDSPHGGEGRQLWLVDLEPALRR